MTALDSDRAVAVERNPLLTAVRTRIGLVVLLFALAAVGWAWTVREMRGMDNGPWTNLGGFAWFTGVWVVMMGAMMFPSVAPTVALFTKVTRQRSPLSPYMFVTGYLLTWAGAGVAAYAIGVLAARVFGSSLSWNGHGQTIAGVTLLVAAAYELTPLKTVCLGKCRSPLGTLLGSWREGPTGAVRMGISNGAWCVGCCWALMASLFALGVMSIAWMAFVAGLIALEKLLPWRRVATLAVTTLLVVLGVLLVASPDSIAGLTIPHDKMMM
jgi:predicted metal-binding membrane protein